MDVPHDAAGGVKTCSTCQHWHKVVDPSNIARQTGECREGPPCLTLIPAPNGQGMLQLCGYPSVGPQFPACSRHARLVDFVLREGA